jgi:hypothetical protein
MTAEFDVVCTKLKDNDPDARYVRTYGLPFGWGRTLGEALTGNTQVRSLDIRLNNLLTNDNESELYTDIDGERVEYFTSGIRRFICESQSLKEVAIQFTPFTPDIEPSVAALLSTLFLMAVAQSPKLEGFQLTSAAPVPSIELARLLETTQTLTHFSVDGAALEGKNGHDLIVREFGANRTLTNLSLWNVHDNQLLEGIIGQLGAYPALKYLNVRAFQENVPILDEAFETLLRRTHSLSNLGLRGYHINGRSMERMVDGLKANHTLRTLRLEGNEGQFCLSKTAMLSFANYMQQRGTANTLDSLELVDCPPWVSTMLNGDSIKGIPLMMLLLGTSLRELSLTAIQDDVILLGFLDEYARFAKRIRLERLVIWNLCAQSYAALLRCLPHLVYLQSVTFFVKGFDVDSSAAGLLASLRKNGSLRSVSYSSPCRKTADRFTERNRNVIRLLTPLREDTFAFWSWDDTPSSNLHLFPSLFKVVQPAQRIAPNSIFMGLLNASVFAGPPVKRSTGRKKPGSNIERVTMYPPLPRKPRSNMPVESVIMYPPLRKKLGSNVPSVIMFPQSRKTLGGNFENAIMYPPLPRKPRSNVESVSMSPLPKKLEGNVESVIMHPQSRKKLGGNVESLIKYTQSLGLSAKRVPSRATSKPKSQSRK